MKIKNNRLFFKICSTLALALLCALFSLQGVRGQADGQNYSELYIPVNDSAAESFVERGLFFAEKLYGKPMIAVKRVKIRLSTPIDGDANLRQKFQLCEMTDPANGLFTIYLSREPWEYAFYGQLAHEIAHLLNARLFDCYVEGLNTVFAEKLLKKEGKDWSGWLKHYQSGADPLYAQCYFMMKEICAVAGGDNMKKFLEYSVYSDQKREKMRVDIDAWLNSLPLSKRKRIKKIVFSYAPSIQGAIASNSFEFAFVLPER